MSANAQATPIESYAAFQGPTSCSPSAKPGTRQLEAYLLRSYRGSGTYGISRQCSVGGPSEHKEGRALDWKVNYYDARQRAMAEDFLRRLMATDKEGHRHALMRRMGVMYVIWNDRIFSAYRANEGWRRYSGWSDHRNHVHISLSWAGARGATSWYRGIGDSAGQVEPPREWFQRSDLREFTHTTIVQPRSAGRPVAAVQKALRFRRITGYFGPTTKARVMRYQKSRKIVVDGIVGPQTWGTIQKEIDAEAKLIREVDHTTITKLATKGKAVKVLERALNRPEDGTFTKDDRSKVVDFQRTHLIPQTGRVDKITWDRLQKV